VENTRHHLRYASLFAVPMVIAFALLGLSYLALFRAGETIGIEAAAKIQQTEDIRYSSALFYRPRPYKIERAALAKAEIVLLGSSRALQFVAAPWQAPAINSGGAMRDLDSGGAYIKSILAHYRPKQMIIVLDWWWFATNRQFDDPTEASPLTPITLHELTQPAVWLWDGYLAPHDFWTLLTAPSRLQPGMGIPARFDDAGWDPFGHYDYGQRLTVPSGGHDVRFKETLEDIARDSKRNDRAPWQPFSQPAWLQLEALIRQLQDQGTELILILPPVAPPVHDWLAAQPEPNIVNEVRRRLPALPVLTFDFHDPASIGTTSCEFVDGTHGGEVTYLRVLGAIAADPSSHLDQALDRAMIERLIAENVGRATLRREGRVPEADFNGLGCQK
jgi:hypothetical protein